MMNKSNNKVAVITGTSGGIGEEIASQLAKKGWELIFLNRSKAKTEPVIQRLQKESPNVKVTLYPVDLAKPGKIEAAVESVKQSYSAVHALINNAGVLFDKAVVSESGNDLHFQVNVIAPYLLMQLLRDLLKAGAGQQGQATVVNVSSNAIFMSKPLDVGQLKRPDRQGIFTSYANSKMAITLLSKQLADQYQQDHIRIYAIDPGGNRTDMTSGEAAPFFVRWFRGLLPPPSKGASYLVAPLVDPHFQAKSGNLLSSGKIKPIPKKSDTKEKAKELMELMNREVR